MRFGVLPAVFRTCKNIVLKKLLLSKMVSLVKVFVYSTHVKNMCPVFRTCKNIVLKKLLLSKMVSLVKVFVYSASV